MARLALSPVPTDCLVVLLLLLPGTAPPEACRLRPLPCSVSSGSGPCSLQPPPASHLPPLVSFPLPWGLGLCPVSAKPMGWARGSEAPAPLPPGGVRLS